MSDLPTRPIRSPEISQRFWRTSARRRRVWTISLSVSLGVHILGLVLYAVGSRGFSIPASGVTSLTNEANPLDGTQLIRLREAEETELDRPEAPPVIVPVPSTRAQPVPQQRPVPGGGLDPEDDPFYGVLNAERLSVPTEGDPRIWSFVDPDRGALTDAELYQISLWWKLAAWYDSVGAAGEAARRAMDWTYTDANGGKWGVSPGKIHLGNLTLPLPFSFDLPPTQRETIGRQIAEWEEINRAAQTNAVWESWKVRSREIRARRDRERADSTGVGSR